MHWIKRVKFRAIPPFKIELWIKLNTHLRWIFCFLRCFFCFFRRFCWFRFISFRILFSCTNSNVQYSYLNKAESIFEATMCYPQRRSQDLKFMGSGFQLLIIRTKSWNKHLNDFYLRLRANQRSIVWDCLSTAAWLRYCLCMILHSKCPTLLLPRRKLV